MKNSNWDIRIKRDCIYGTGAVARVSAGWLEFSLSGNGKTYSLKAGGVCGGAGIGMTIPGSMYKELSAGMKSFIDNYSALKSILFKQLGKMAELPSFSSNLYVPDYAFVSIAELRGCYLFLIRAGAGGLGIGVSGMIAVFVDLSLVVTQYISYDPVVNGAVIAMGTIGSVANATGMNGPMCRQIAMEQNIKGVAFFGGLDMIPLPDAGVEGCVMIPLNFIN